MTLNNAVNCGPGLISAQPGSRISVKVFTSSDWRMSMHWGHSACLQCSCRIRRLPKMEWLSQRGFPSEFYVVSFNDKFHWSHFSSVDQNGKQLNVNLKIERFEWILIEYSPHLNESCFGVSHGRMHCWMLSCSPGTRTCTASRLCVIWKEQIRNIY